MIQDLIKRLQWTTVNNKLELSEITQKT
jgi:hypothetical protein